MAISRATFRPGSLGVAQGPGQGVDGAMGQLGDQDQRGRDQQQAPADRPDAQQGGGQGDEQAAIGVGEEAGIAADGVLQPAQPGGDFSRKVCRPARAAQRGTGSHSVEAARLRSRSCGRARPGGPRARLVDRGDAGRRIADPVLGSGRVGVSGASLGRGRTGSRSG